MRSFVLLVVVLSFFVLSAGIAPHGVTPSMVSAQEDCPISTQVIFREGDVLVGGLPVPLNEYPVVLDFWWTPATNMLGIVLADGNYLKFEIQNPPFLEGTDSWTSVAWTDIHVLAVGSNGTVMLVEEDGRKLAMPSDLSWKFEVPYDSVDVELAYRSADKTYRLGILDVWTRLSIFEFKDGEYPQPTKIVYNVADLRYVSPTGLIFHGDNRGPSGTLFQFDIVNWTPDGEPTFGPYFADSVTPLLTPNVRIFFTRVLDWTLYSDAWAENDFDLMGEYSQPAGFFGELDTISALVRIGLWTGTCGQ
jgi:hypothetical protein